MAFKVNYNQQRAERNRAKQAKQDAKQREKEEEIARRKAERDNPSAPAAEPQMASDAPKEDTNGPA